MHKYARVVYNSDTMDGNALLKCIYMYSVREAYNMSTREHVHTHITCVEHAHIETSIICTHREHSIDD